ncbi:MAG: adenylate/guanylate cyclase domain-containing protein [Fibrobacterales bacterium]
MSVINPKTRFLIHGASLITALFLAVYAKMVCQFIDSVPVYQIVQNIAALALFQIGIREFIFRYVIDKQPLDAAPRVGYYSAIALWAVSGVIAVVIHHYRYADFPFGSHLKMLSGYWILGSGILAQWERVLLERQVRSINRSIGGFRQFPERFTRRIMQGFVLFTTLPLLGILILITRYVMEDVIAMNVAYEIGYLIGFYATMALIVAWYYGKGLSEDTQIIVDEVQKIGDGNFEVALEASRPDELGKVAAGIHDMAKGLRQRERIKDAFGRFVSPHVAEEFIKNYSNDGDVLTMGGTKKKLTILVVDIRGFTKLSEETEPEKLTAMLNEYFSRMVEVIKIHNGIVDKFIGDAILAVFGLTESSEGSEYDAVQAAAEMSTQLKLFNHIRSKKGHPKLYNGIGVHCGEVIAGYIGSTDRLEFTVIGSPVNVAARIESQCKEPNPSLLFSEAVVKGLKGRVAVREVGLFDLKGVSEQMNLFTLNE